MSKYKVGVIGCGRAGTGRARAFDLHPLCEVVAGADTDPKNLELFCQRFDVPGYNTYEAMFENEQLDITLPILPVNANADAVVASAQAGVKAIFCEKPLTASLEDADRMVEELEAIKSKAFGNQIKSLEGGALKESAHIQWFHAADRFAPMGVKMVGLFCETIKDSNFIDPKKYIAGFQIIPNEIPGFGHIAFNEVKVSMRVPAYLERKIKQGSAEALNTFLPDATNRLGGFSDACHSLTAATTVAIGKEEDLIEEMERILGA